MTIQALLGATALALALAGCASGGGAPAAGAAPFSVALWGDMPYARSGAPDLETPKIAPLIDDINAAGVAFTIFDGDIKSGSTRCDDAEYAKALGFFARFRAPLVYVPGDNEWTDCHRRNNGGFDPLERLAHIRRTMTPANASHGQNPMPVERQAAPGSPYSENLRWQHAGVWFLGLNVSGSNNNRVGPGECLDAGSARTPAECAAANAEYRARDAANIAWLRDTFARARAARAPALVVVIQANPGFDIPETPAVERGAPGTEGYDAFVDALAAETEAFAGQVLLVHGDSHVFRIDKPLHGRNRMLKNFTRLETFGSPDIHWVRLRIDPASRSVFSFEPMLVPGN